MADWIIIATGLAVSWLLFWRFDFLGNGDGASPSRKLSVIIPVRNEEANIARLIGELLEQSDTVDEIICVNDGSTDRSATIISGYPVILVDIEEKPEGWMGKSYACFLGAKKSSNDLLLFIDSDVSLKKGAIGALLHAYDKHRMTISVLPYHKMEKRFEWQSLFFNLIQVGANGASLVKRGIHAGLYGPVILIEKKTYQNIGTHEAIRQSIVDDVALGHLLHERDYDFELCLGGELVSYRMYQDRRSLFQGWVKNYATGAQYAPKLLGMMVFFWVASLLGVTIKLAGIVFGGQAADMPLVAIGFFAWFAELNRIAPKIGNFKKWSLALFPYYILVFVAVFAISLTKKILRRPVTWKGRKIKVEK